MTSAPRRFTSYIEAWRIAGEERALASRELAAGLLRLIRDWRSRLDRLHSRPSGKTSP